MKKLIQLLETNIQVSSLSCANVKVDSDTSGDKVNDALLNDICKAAKNAQVTVTITTAISGHAAETAAGNPSRHPSGNAVDISLINNASVKTPSNRNNVDNRHLTFRCYVGDKLEVKLLLPVCNLERENAIVMATEYVKKIFLKFFLFKNYYLKINRE